MMSACSTNVCGEPGIVLTVGADPVADVLPSDVACNGVSASCQVSDAGACTQYYLLPIATGNCHIDVDLTSGKRFSTDLEVVKVSGCSGFYTNPSSAALVEVP